jgi:Glycosyltransferase family 87
MGILILVGAALGAGLIARGELAGADARAYWAGVRIWLSGGNPYHPTGPFMPYVYAPWMLPLFAPWAMLPWDVAWFVWRGGAILALLWTIHWAYRQRPLSTAVAVLLLSFPIAANLDTGNMTLILAFALWATYFVRPAAAGFLWGLATWMKWVPALFWFVLAPRARGWGLIWLLASALLSVATLPLTILQLQTLFGFGDRPLRLDYLVLLWAAVPSVWLAADPVRWLRPATWRSGFVAWRAGPQRQIRELLGLRT